jgi:hypothetical protein
MHLWSTRRARRRCRQPSTSRTQQTDNQRPLTCAPRRTVRHVVVDKSAVVQQYSVRSVAPVASRRPDHQRHARVADDLQRLNGSVRLVSTTAAERDGEKRLIGLVHRRLGAAADVDAEFGRQRSDAAAARQVVEVALVVDVQVLHQADERVGGRLAVVRLTEDEDLVDVEGVMFAGQFG